MKGKNSNNFENDFTDTKKPLTKGKSGGKTNGKNSESNSINWSEIKRYVLLKDEAARTITGLLLIVFSLFSLTSIVSFLLYWKSDLSIIQVEVDPGLNKIENWMGTLGARFGHVFVYKGFGLLSLVIPIFSMHFGLLLMIRKRMISPLVWLKYVASVGLWFMLTMGGFYDTISPVLGGAVGYYLFDTLNQTVGMLGTILFILLSGYLILWLMFGFDLLGLESIFRKKEETLPDSIEEENDLVHAGETLFEKDKIEIDEFEEPPVKEEKPNEFSFKVVDEPKIKIKEDKEEQELSLEVNEIVQEEEKPEIIKEEENVEKEHYGIDTLFDPKLDLRDYQFPDLDFLNDYGGDGQKEVSRDELEKSKNMIVETLKNYNIGISSIKATTGPTVTLFEIIPAAGIKISRIKNLEDDIALSLAALGIRIIAPIPGRGTIGIEVPNKNPKIVSMKAMIQSSKFQNSDLDLPVCLGRNISNEVFVSDLAKMPHLLMAGATGQGKSVGLNALLISLLYKKHPSELKFVLVDPKKVELTLFRTIERHYLAKLPGEGDAIITDNKLVITTLKSLCLEMDNRYELLQSAMVRNLKEYNHKFIHRKLNPNEGHRFLPYIVVIIDEVADLIMTAGKEVEHPISRLAQLARAIGIHLVLATQRPSVNIITGTIKANFPARIAFRVTSKIDSRTILDANGADQLIGRGDMLFSNGNDLIRLQCPFVDTPEVEKVTAFIGAQRGYPQALQLPAVAEDDGETELGDMDSEDWDSLFEEAARIIVSNQQGSTSMLQRKLKIGYNRAGRLIDQMEIANIVGPFKGSQAREVLIKDENSLEQILQEILNE
ncbi:MAG: DNA translocase FtsK 4TM domain-containing protein [Flavobacteriales bacterium]|nr:DNA translocase FtsK 4TM domain-containing protein [Flavobacteriales bacterium]